MASAASGGAGRTRGPGRIGLDLGDRRIGLRSRQKEGSLTGPNPVDRGMKGSKLHILSDAQGIPLAVAVSGANMHDSLAFKPLILGIPAGRSRRGPRRRRPVKLRADKAYFSAEHRIWLRERGLVARIARPGFESGERLGRHRWKIDRSLGSSATGGAVAAPRPALGSPICCPRHARGAVGAPAAGCPQRVKLQASETLYSRRVGCRASSRPGLWRGRRELQTARHADMPTWTVAKNCNSWAWEKGLRSDFEVGFDAPQLVAGHGQVGVALVEDEVEEEGFLAASGTQQ